MSTENAKTGQGLYGKWKSALDLAFSGKSKKERMLYPALAAFFAAIAFLLCAKSLPYTDLAIGAPLADALLCAAGAYTPFVYVGNVLGSAYFGLMSIERILALTFVFILRIITSAKNIAQKEEAEIFSENIITRLAVSAVMCFIQCGMFLAVNGITAESARSVLSTLICTPLLTLIFSVYYSKRSETRAQRATHELSMLFIFACIVYCAGDITYAFFTLDTLFAVFFTLCVAKYGGFARGAICGFALGYITAPAYFAAFILLGAIGALVFSFGTYSACGIASAVACVCAIFIGGTSALTSIVPETVMACAVTSPILRYSFLPSGFPFPTSDAAYAESFSENARRVLEEISFIGSLRSASDNLRAVSDNVNDVSAPFEHERQSARRTAEQVCTEFCEHCTMSPICLETHGESTRSALTELIQMRFDGTESADSIPPYLSSHCIRLRELSEYIKKTVLSADKGEPRTELTPTLTYPAAADIISGITAKAESELVFDGASERAVARLLYSSGVPFGGVSVIGSVRKKVCIYGSQKSKLKKALPELQKGLKSIFGFSFGEPSISDEPACPVIFSPANSLKTEVALSVSSKSGERISGDTAISFLDGNGNFYALISDGMGSGEAAGKSSAITAELIRSFMLSGIDEALAVRLAGEALPSLCDECFSTVDLMKLDLVNGEASVIKNHAAASYILRGGSVYCCNASSMPIGISREATSERLSFTLGAGDTVIMVSDGVAEGPTDKVKITDMLGLSGELDAQSLADKILARASEINGKGDDMSALVIKISEAS